MAAIWREQSAYEARGRSRMREDSFTFLLCLKLEELSGGHESGRVAPGWHVTSTVP